MIKQIISVMIIAIAVTFSAISQAQNIAVVNIQAAILESSFAQAELAKLEKGSSYAGLVSEAQILVADIQALDKDAEANGSKWSQEQLAEYNKARQFLTADYELNNKKIQAERERVVRQINAAMTQPAREALMQLVEDEKITVLLKQEAIYLASPEHDITAKLAEKLSK